MAAQQQKKRPPPHIHAVAGIAAGACSTTLLYPLDLVRALASRTAGSWAGAGEPQGAHVLTDERSCVLSAPALQPLQPHAENAKVPLAGCFWPHVDRSGMPTAASRITTPIFFVKV